MNARTKILAKLRRQVAGVDLGKLPQEPDYPFNTENQQGQLQQFIQLLEQNRAKVLQTSVAELARVIEQELKALGMSRLMYGKNTPYTQAIESVKGNVVLKAFDFALDDAGKNLLFDEVEAGITSSHCAIAALGAVVLWPNTDEPRSLSLVPEAHFVIVERERIYADFPTLIKQQHWYDKMPTNVVLVSGPSKTGDIQQHMAFGAHGPKHLVVLLV